MCALETNVPVMIPAFTLAAAAVLGAVSAEPLRVGVLACEPHASGSPSANLVAGARFVVLRWNAKGGLAGAQVELVVESCRDEPGVLAALGRLEAAGVLALVAPLEPNLAEATRRAARGKIPCASFSAGPPAVAAALDLLVETRFSTLRVAHVHDASRDARELAKILKKGGLRSGAEIVADLGADAGDKAIAKAVQSGRPDLLFVDLEAGAAQEFLSESALGAQLPVLLSPRALAASASPTTGAWVFCGRSLETCAGAEALRAEFAAAPGTLGPGTMEGYEALVLLGRAVETATARDRAAVEAALATAAFEGPRGKVELDPKLGAIALPLAAWRVTSAGIVPYSPVVIPLAAASAATAVAKSPDTTLGVPFKTWRTRSFVLEDDTQQVVCQWANDAEHATIDDDLAELGLSTRGASPLFDHLVKEELMARMLAIVNTKFLRNEDGSAIEKKSFRISFSTRAPKKGGKFWMAWFGGDHPDAGGEAFGTWCRTYTRFIRRTIFQPHALVPPASPLDLQYLDGTYRYGTDHAQDKRSELIRALINGYAGSMALTTAHEVGHLCTLDHVLDDPVDIMNVNEGAGIDHSVAHFGASTYPRLVKVLGLVGQKK